MGRNTKDTSGKTIDKVYETKLAEEGFWGNYKLVTGFRKLPVKVQL